jgi:hypothetical protein
MRKRALRTALVAIILLTIVHLGPSGALADDSGWKSPSQDNTSSGGEFVSAPNAYADINQSYAEAEFELGGGTKAHNYWGYDLGIPDCATVEGITVVPYYCIGDTGPGRVELGVRLSWDGGISWTDVMTTTYMPSCPTSLGTSQTFGGGEELWGHAWTPAELSNDNFRVKLIADTDT